jgi:hypothetical protein
LVAAIRSWHTTEFDAGVTVPKGIEVGVDAVVVVVPSHDCAAATAFTVKLKVGSTVSESIDALV